nr:hypothetical protein BJQ95_03384 [Cryobacterium sp. SO1]
MSFRPWQAHLQVGGQPQPNSGSHLCIGLRSSCTNHPPEVAVERRPGAPILAGSWRWSGDSPHSRTMEAHGHPNERYVRICVSMQIILCAVVTRRARAWSSRSKYSRCSPMPLGYGSSLRCATESCPLTDRPTSSTRLRPPCRSTSRSSGWPGSFRPGGVRAVLLSAVLLGAVRRWLCCSSTRTLARGYSQGSCTVDRPERNADRRNDWIRPRRCCQRDSDRIGQVLKISLDNAGRHTPSGREVVISAAAVDERSPTRSMGLRPTAFRIPLSVSTEWTPAGTAPTAARE